MPSAIADAAFRLTPSLAQVLAGAGVVRVGTENRAKLGAVALALEALRESPSDLASEPASMPARALQILPANVASDVPEQPIGWTDIKGGARNRARAAFALGDCVMAIGIEDGLVRLSEEAPAGDGRDYFNVGCAWVTDGEREGHGFSSGFAYPPGSLEPAIRDQAPIGDLFDGLWRSARSAPAARADSTRSPGSNAAPTRPATTAPSGRGGGNIGLLTGGRLERADYGSHAVLCALVPFLHADLYA